MDLHKSSFRIFIVLIISMVCINVTIAQEKKVASTSPQLYNEIAKMDSIIFDAFNHQNIRLGSCHTNRNEQ